MFRLKALLFMSALLFSSTHLRAGNFHMELLTAEDMSKGSSAYEMRKERIENWPAHSKKEVLEAFRQSAKNYRHASNHFITFSRGLKLVIDGKVVAATHTRPGLSSDLHTPLQADVLGTASHKAARKQAHPLQKDKMFTVTDINPNTFWGKLSPNNPKHLSMLTTLLKQHIHNLFYEAKRADKDNFAIAFGFHHPGGDDYQGFAKVLEAAGVLDGAAQKVSHHKDDAKGIHVYWLTSNCLG
ncbi:hypothetical protein OAN22_00730 [Alphaproteobacteria bacterium]|nr:hypothetical protein [Alphaproteobacteria bacterium]